MIIQSSIPAAVPGVKLTGILISLLLTIPPDIIIVADTIPDDSDPSNVDDENVTIGSVNNNTNNGFATLLITYNYHHYQ